LIKGNLSEDDSMNFSGHNEPANETMLTQFAAKASDFVSFAGQALCFIK